MPFRKSIFNVLIKQLLTPLILLLPAASLAAQTVKLPSFSEDNTLPYKLLRTAVQRAGLEFTHPYENEGQISNARVLNDVKTGALDVMWSMTSSELEQDYQAIYYPIFRGMLGLRLAIVPQHKSNLFANVSSLSDLRRFSAGQGKTWPDTKILEHNGLTVAKTLKYPNLFYMVEGGRFDYFPRGIHEPWNEVKTRPELNLTVEPNILIKYRAPMYFFVRKGNNGFHKQLVDALESMVADGTFEQMFFEDEQVQSALTLANVSKRRIIELDNPLLSDKTPLNRSELWFDPLTYKKQ